MAGIYGVMSYVVTQRTSELGLRMALGAARGDVIGLVLSRAAVLAAVGLAIGAGLSLAVSRLIGAMLFGLQATDPATYAMVLLSVGGHRDSRGGWDRRGALRASIRWSRCGRNDLAGYGKIASCGRS